MPPRVFIFVIASFGDPVYTDLIKLRKLQLKKYNIPHYFLFDENPPSHYVFDNNDIFIEKETNTKYEIKIPSFEKKDMMTPTEFCEWSTYILRRQNAHMNPFMIQRFLKGLKLIDETQYDYIIRVNISTFININNLMKEIESYPKTKFATAHLIKQKLPDWNIYNNTELVLFSGTCIICTSDTISYLKTIDINSEILSCHNDDTVLSHLLHQYISSYKSLHACFLETNMVCDDKNLDSPIFRIKNNIDRHYDILHWIYLLKKIDNIDVDFNGLKL